jgi:hypothetical protein
VRDGAAKGRRILRQGRHPIRLAQGRQNDERRRITFTKLNVDARLIEEARTLGGHRTKKEAVRTALEEYVQRRKQVEVLSLFGTIEYDEQYDYRRERRAKPM